MKEREKNIDAFYTFPNLIAYDCVVKTPTVKNWRLLRIRNI
jgi:hypothetical protein